MKLYFTTSSVLSVLALLWTGPAQGQERATNQKATSHGSTNGAAAELNNADAVTAEQTNLLDVELDPLAFAANGFSVHAGFRIDHWRIDLGAYGAELPSFLLSNDAFRSRFSGFGMKLDYHLRDDVGGVFFGIAVSRVANTIRHEPTSLSEIQFLHEVSARVGYEFDLAWGLYLVPWVSVGTIFGSEDVTVGDDSLDAQGPLSIFPTVHLGYRL